MIKKLYNSLIIAFSMYSKLPMPHADWEKENMRYTFCFFPLVGAVIGALVYAWSLVSSTCSVDGLLRAAVYVLIPFVISGGIHLDGFLDTCDALHAYAPRERRLEIMKDPHAGAFAVICGINLYVVNLGLWSQVSAAGAQCLAFGFVISRCMSGWSVAAFPCAKDSGLAVTFHDAAHRRAVRLVCAAELLVLLVVLYVRSPFYMLCMTAAAVLSLCGYGYIAKKQFGGITGDLAGWFLQVNECLMAAAVVLGEMIWYW